MKLIPFLRFGGSGTQEIDDEFIERPPDELFEPPSDEEEEEKTEDEEQSEDEEEKTEDSAEEKGSASDDEMLKVFIAAEEEFVDNSGLASQLEDVPAEQLVQELRALAPAFGIRLAASEEEAV